MKPYFFCLTVCSRRSGAPIGKRVGVVFADTEKKAEEIAWEKFGNESSCQLWAQEILPEGMSFTVYKSEI